MNLLTLKKSKIASKFLVILLGSLLLIPTLSFGASDDVVIPITDAKKIVVSLEKSSIYEKQVILLEKANIQLTEQNVILLEQNKLLKEQLQLKQEKIDLTVKILDEQKQVYEDKIKVYEKEKPSIFDKVLMVGGGIGLGILLVILL